MYILLNMEIFHCYASLLEGIMKWCWYLYTVFFCKSRHQGFAAAADDAAAAADGHES